MFIQFFKSNNPSAFVFLPLIAIAIWAFGFMEASVFPVEHAMPLYGLLAGIVENIPWLGNFIALILIIGEALLLNYIVNENEVLTKQSFLPALFYIIFMSNNNYVLVLYPLIFANLFLLFAINKLLNSYRKDNAFSQAFDAGLLISIATLFYFPYAVLFPLLGVGLIIMRPFNWREWLISFIGVLVPYIFVITFYFWNDLLDYFFYNKVLYSFLSPPSQFDFPKSFYFMIIVSTLILLVSFGKLFSGQTGGSQKSKKSIVLLIWIFVFAGISALIAREIPAKYFSALAIPAAVFSANYFLNIKKQWLGEVLFLLLIGSIIYNLIVHYF